MVRIVFEIVRNVDFLGFVIKGMFVSYWYVFEVELLLIEEEIIMDLI